LVLGPNSILLVTKRGMEITCPISKNEMENIYVFEI
jgi:hypothetical protein